MGREQSHRWGSAFFSSSRMDLRYGDITHNGTRGRVREILDEYFGSYLPCLPISMTRLKEDLACHACLPCPASIARRLINPCAWTHAYKRRIIPIWLQNWVLADLRSRHSACHSPPVNIPCLQRREWRRAVDPE